MEEFEREQEALIANTYTRQPIMIVKGEGPWVWDRDGRKYLDCYSGIAVNNLGHCHPEVVKAIKEQAERLIHTSNIFYTEPQLVLAKVLARESGGYKSFFCNSGAEANEAAIKLVRKFAGPGEIITATDSFHGRTMATISATGQPKYQQGFEPLLEGFRHVPFGDAGAIEDVVTEETAAVMLEPIQGEGGVVVPPENYLKDVAAICEKKGVLLVLDEVQTGFGRTGEMFAWQGSGVDPDIFTVAKAMGGGMPIGAMLAKPGVMSAFEPGDHASTFGGNPVACAAAVASINVILKENLLERSRTLGEHFKAGLLELKPRHTEIRDVRGKGLMIGVEIEGDGAKIIEKAREQGLLFNCAHGNVLRFTPPLNIDRELIDRIVQTLDSILSEGI